MNQDSDIEALKARVSQLEGLVQTLMIKYGGVSDPSRMVSLPQLTGLYFLSLGPTTPVIILQLSVDGLTGTITFYDAAGNQSIVLDGASGQVIAFGKLLATTGAASNALLATASATANAGAAVLPANPRGFMNVEVGGVAKKVPYYDV